MPSTTSVMMILPNHEKKVKTVFKLMMRVKTEAGVREETRGIRQTAAYFIIY